MHKNTKIIATLGPASDTYTTIKKMVKAGMNVARLNFSHGSHKNHKQLIENIRKVSKDLNIEIGIIQDLQGPKIRVGQLDQSINIKKGENITLSTTLSKDKFKNKKGSFIPIQYKKLPQEVVKGSVIFINDGLIKLKVVTTNKKNIITCKVIYGGEIASRKGMNIINAKLSTQTLTKKDLKDLEFGIKNKVDFIALSFVKNAKDIQNLKKRLKKTKIKVIAKIERAEAVKEKILIDIIEKSDGVMVARGDLGVEISPEHVPLLQKRIINLAKYASKPVITATQMMQSMIKNSSPTRAEVSDIANAILDQTDAIMLSNETSVGNYPIKSVRMMKKIANTVESEMSKHPTLLPNSINKMPINCANTLAGIKLAKNIKADLIIILTKYGNAAKEISKYRVFTKTIIITENEKLKKQLTLSWGLNDILCVKKLNKLENQEILKKLCIKSHKKKQKIIILNSLGKNKKIDTIII